MYTLVIGNKNYSSWSMRPWVLMRDAGIPFTEMPLRFDSFEPGSAFKRSISQFTPTEQVPVLLIHGAGDEPLAVWDTLAIAETLAERHPEAQLWPADPAQRARARSLCAEMHAGFRALRGACPQNLEAHLPEVGQRVLAEQPAVAADLARLIDMWSGLLRQHGGPWLFGQRFSIADAFYAPVAGRMRSYALPVPADVTGYIEGIFNRPSVAEWLREARAEADFLAYQEPYRRARG